MKKGKTTILTSVIAVMLVSVAIGAGTLAYFTDTASATGNTFTAGNLNVKLSLTETGGYNENLDGVWSTPDNWAPGEVMAPIRIYFRNDGNVPVQVVGLDFTNYQYTGASTFRDVIEVNHFEEKGVGEYSAFLADWTDFGGNNNGDETDDGGLTLRELMSVQSHQGHVGTWDLLFFETSPGKCLDPECDATSNALLGGDYLAPNEVRWIELGFKFSNTAGDTYQEATCSFDLEMTFIQGPTSGICRHEIPGFVQ